MRLKVAEMSSTGTKPQHCLLSRKKSSTITKLMQFYGV